MTNSIPLHAGRGSGVYGSIKSSDLAGMSAAQPTAAAAGPVAPQGGYIDIPVSNIRGVIANRLLESKQQIPHYYVTVECQVDNVSKCILSCVVHHAHLILLT